MQCAGRQACTGAVQQEGKARQSKKAKQGQGTRLHACLVSQEARAMVTRAMLFLHVVIV